MLAAPATARLGATANRGGASLRAAVARGATRRAVLARPARAGPVVARANELNKWANHDASDDIDGDNEGDYAFDRETAKIVLRVLTARSAQRVLAQLGDTDLFVQQWFNHFLADNPPLKGDVFIRALFKERAVYAKDKVTGTEHFVSPSQLAHRVLLQREEMAKSVSAGFPEYAKRCNVDLLRSHLTESSYTSGTTPATSEKKGRGGSASGR